MPDKVVAIPGVGNVSFPDSMSDADIAAVAAKQYAATQQPSEQSKPSTLTALGMRAAGAAAGPIATGVENFATDPNAWKTWKAVGEAIGGVTGLVKGGPVGAAAGMWAGSKVGWRTANAAQKIATAIAPTIARIAKAAPYMNAASGAQGVLDLAQMAEPNRKDIGVMGIGSESRTPEEKQAHPALINALAAYIMKELAGKK